MRKVKLTVFGLMFCLLLHLTGCAAAQKPLRVTLVLKTVTEVAEFWERSCPALKRQRRNTASSWRF